MNTLTQADLKPCDVLLFKGCDIISDLINLLDGGPYSHAAFYNGNNVDRHGYGNGST